MVRQCKERKYKPRAKTLAAQALAAVRLEEKQVVKFQEFYPLRLENVACQVDLGCNINIRHTSQVLFGEYDPKAFPDCVGRCYEPRCTLSLFNSGKVVSAGTKSEIECRLAMSKMCNTLSWKLGYDCNLYNFEVVNMVATFCVGYAVDLELWFFDNGGTDDEFDPELIKCVRHKISSPSARFSIYPSGAVVLCGCKRIEDLHEAYKQLDLSKYKITDDPNRRTVPEERRRERKHKIKKYIDHHCDGCESCNNNINKSS